MDGESMFAREDGTPLHPEQITKTFLRQVKPQACARIRLHDLRHGQASLMLAAGVEGLVPPRASTDAATRRC